MNIQTEVLVETLKTLISDLSWCCCNIFSTQYHDVDTIMHDESADMFSWKVDILEEYW